MQVIWGNNMVNINLARRQNIETQAKEVAPSGLQQLTQFATGALSISQKIKDQNEEARINNTITQMNVDLMNKTEEWKTKYSSNPNSKEGKAFLNDAYKQTIESYANNFEGKYKNQFMRSSSELIGKYQLTNSSWQLAQNKENTVTQINDSIKNSLNEAYQTGRLGNIGQSAVNFETYYKNLAQIGNNVIGEAETAKLLKNYKSDYYKSAIAGLLDEQPERALQVLESKEIIDGIGDAKDIKQLRDMAMNRFENISQVKAMKELSGFALKHGDMFNKAVSGNLSSGELLQFVNGEGSRLSKNAQSALFKMAGYSKKDLEDGKKYTKEEKIQFGNDIDIAFMKIGEYDDGKKKLDSGAKLEDLINFQDKLYEDYASGKIKESKFNYYNNLILMPLQEKINKLPGKNKFFADQKIDESLSSIKEVATAMGNTLGSAEADTLTALDVLAAGATETKEEAAKLSAKLKKENAEILYTDDNRQELNMLFLSKLNNKIRNESGNTKSIADLGDMPQEQKGRLLMETAIEARNEFIVSKYPQLAKQANLPEAVYMKNKGLMYSMLNPNANRTASASVNSTRKVQKDTTTGKYYLVDVDPNTNKKRIVKELSAIEAGAYYGK